MCPLWWKWIDFPLGCEFSKNYEILYQKSLYVQSVVFKFAIFWDIEMLVPFLSVNLCLHKPAHGSFHTLLPYCFVIPYPIIRSALTMEREGGIEKLSSYSRRSRCSSSYSLGSPHRIDSSLLSSTHETVTGRSAVQERLIISVTHFWYLYANPELFPKRYLVHLNGGLEFRLASFKILSRKLKIVSVVELHENTKNIRCETDYTPSKTVTIQFHIDYLV